MMNCFCGLHHCLSAPCLNSWTSWRSMNHSKSFGLSELCLWSINGDGQWSTALSGGVGLRRCFVSAFQCPHLTSFFWSTLQHHCCGCSCTMTYWTPFACFLCRWGLQLKHLLLRRCFLQNVFASMGTCVQRLRLFYMLSAGFYSMKLRLVPI